MRARIKKQLSAHAMQLAVDKLETLMAQGHDPAAVLNQSTFNNWQGLFALKDAPAKAQEEPVDVKAAELAEKRRKVLAKYDERT
ncbi:MAG: hypothetical protein FD174_2594 [Geobacteraceae bacterium]|nr:MAG: hypothetical protein FD174_2594 [Geobacteraceae bacterium]